MALKNLIGISLPIIILFGALMWISIFSNTYKHSDHLDKKYRKLTSIFNATVISLAIVDAVYITIILFLRNL